MLTFLGRYRRYSMPGEKADLLPSCRIEDRQQRPKLERTKAGAVCLRSSDRTRAGGDRRGMQRSDHLLNVPLSSVIDRTGRCMASAFWLNFPASVQSGWLPNVVETALTGLNSQSSFAIGIGATCMFAHQVASLPCRCSSRWCLRQSGTVNSSLTFLPNDRGWATLRWCASQGLA